MTEDCMSIKELGENWISLKKQAFAAKKILMEALSREHNREETDAMVSWRECSSSPFGLCVEFDDDYFTGDGMPECPYCGEFV